eukprot:TRINITY_DN1553_c0_g1_i8.p1 TRINITY_DN1553_c0_g1~~TRINITY_DN1553_c0_g1_i8.p1  ORF type:complete len:235 (+),score=35.96 TRINITY_DN1553_c0_g1_i8:51-755(+)
MKVCQQRVSALNAFLLFFMFNVSCATDSPPSSCTVKSFDISGIKAEHKLISPLTSKDKEWSWVATVRAEAECGKWHYTLDDNREYKIKVSSTDARAGTFGKVILYRKKKGDSYLSHDFDWNAIVGGEYEEECSHESAGTWSEKGYPVNDQICYYYSGPVKICRSNKQISMKLKARLRMRLKAYETQVDSEGVDVLDTTTDYECPGEEINFVSTACRAVHGAVVAVVFALVLCLW